MTPREEAAQALQECASPDVAGESLWIGEAEYFGFFGPPQIGLEYIPGKTLLKVEFTALIPKAQMQTQPDQNLPCQAKGKNLRIAKLDDAHISWRLHLTNAKA